MLKFSNDPNTYQLIDNKLRVISYPSKDSHDELKSMILELKEQVSTLTKVVLGQMNLKEHYDLKSAASYLGIAPSTLHKYCSNKRIPYSKPNGKNVVFFKSDLDLFLKEKKVKANNITQTPQIDLSEKVNQIVKNIK